MAKPSGKNVKMQAATPVAPAAPVIVVQQQQTQGVGGNGPRPLGVTIVSVLAFLFALAFVGFGIFWIVAATVGSVLVSKFGLPSWIMSIIGVFGAIAAIVCLGIAAIVFLCALGNLRGRGWAWTLVLVLAVLGLVFDVLGLLNASPEGMGGVFVSLLIDAAIVWYYYTPDVKRFFGKGQMRALWQRGSRPA